MPISKKNNSDMVVFYKNNGNSKIVRYVNNNSKNFAKKSKKLFIS